MTPSNSVKPDSVQRDQDDDPRQRILRCVRVARNHVLSDFQPRSKHDTQREQRDPLDPLLLLCRQSFHLRRQIRSSQARTSAPHSVPRKHRATGNAGCNLIKL